MIEPSENDKLRFKENIWEENLRDVMEWILENTKERFEGWQWIKNSRCKYIDIRIDMRDGGFVIKDRDGNRISFEQLRWQYGEEERVERDVTETARPEIKGKV